MNIFMLRESIYSVALSHPESCKCRTCKAAAGDEQVMEELIAELLGDGNA